MNQNVILKIFIIIRLLVFEMFVLGIVFSTRKRLKEKQENIDYSILYVKERFGRINSIVAATRGGKSSFMSALSHAQDVIIRSDISDRIAVIVNTLDKLDFRQINKFLDSVYSYTRSYDLAYKLLLEYINKENFVYCDFINIKSYDEMIKEYAEWYYHLWYRGTFMLCKGISIFDRNNGMPAKLLLDETLKLKEVKNTGIYYGQRCSIFNEDEISVTDSNTKSFDKESKESGKKELKIFLGQMSKETSYYNTCKQVNADEIVSTRRLTNVIYVPTSCKQITYAYPRLQRLLDIYLKIRYFFFKLRYAWVILPKVRRRMMDQKMLSNKCAFKKAVSRVENIRNWCKSEGLLTHRGMLFENDPVNGKLKLIDENVVLTFPLTWSWGAYRTHEYAELQEFMEDLSQVTIDEIINTARISNDTLTFEKLKWVVEKDAAKEEF